MLLEGHIAVAKKTFLWNIMRQVKSQLLTC